MEYALAGCKATSTPTSSMAASMRRLAAALAPDSPPVEMHLVHLPSPSTPLSSTLAPGVRRSSVADFLDALFPPS